MATATKSISKLELDSSLPHGKSVKSGEVPSGKNHMEKKEEVQHHQPSGKRTRNRRKHGKKKDKVSDNQSSKRCNCECESGISQRQKNNKVVDECPPVVNPSRIPIDQCQSDVHQHLNNQSQNHVTEPLKALSHLVEKLAIEEQGNHACHEGASSLSGPPLPIDSSVPSAGACQDGSIDEALAIAKCNSEDEDDADLELPSSLSDFVLGYHDDCHYATTKLPPNDNDIDTIPLDDSGDDCVRLVPYESEVQMPDIIRLITKDLSEPYSIYTYRYFIHNWPHLCYLAMHGTFCVGAIVCKLDVHKKMVRRGYIAMLAVDEGYRKKKLGSSLVKKAIRAMVRGECDEVVLETEITNKPALRLYENLGFVRDKRLFRYYLNGVDALRLKLWLQ